jgi:hypothetical protein
MKPSLGPLVCLFAVSGCNAVVDPDVGPDTDGDAGKARVRVAHLSKRERIVVTAAPAKAG